MQKKSNPPLSIYIHIPFCSKKCPYCHFYVVQDNEGMKDRLLEALMKEFSSLMALFSKRALLSIYFGGGTPLLFGPDRVKKLLQHIYSSEHLEISPHIEITLEANPEHITLPLMQAFNASGINRVSIGIQSGRDNELILLGRKHSFSRGKSAIIDTFQAGIENISIDLMYQIPKQTLSSWKETLLEVKDLPITHLSLYNLTIEENTPFFRKKRELEPLLPNEAIGTDMYTMAIEELTRQGFTHYEISAFCRGSYKACHNIGYWTGREFLGLGPSSFGFFHNKRPQNVPNLLRYCKAIESGDSPVSFVDETPEEERKKELFALSLRLFEGASIDALSSETLQSIEKLIEKELLERHEPHRIRLTKKGLFFYDTVASELI